MVDEGDEGEMLSLIQDRLDILLPSFTVNLELSNVYGLALMEASRKLKNKEKMNKDGSSSTEEEEEKH